MKKWIVILALIVLGYWFNQKIKQLSDNTISRDNHLEQIDEAPTNIPTEVVESPVVDNIEVPAEIKKVQPLPPESQPNSYNHDSSNDPVEDPNQWKKDVSDGTLVSCQTQIQHCQPPEQQNYQDGSITTFCVTYARNCTNPESIQRTWQTEEVFRPIVPEPETNNPVDNYQDQYQPESEQQYNQQDPVAPVDPSTYLPPMPYAEPPPVNHEVVDPSNYNSEY